MESERIEAAWAGAGNCLSPGNARSLTAAFVEELRSRRRRSVFGLVTVAVAFAAITALSVGVVVTQRDLQSQHVATLVAMNVLIWGAWLVGLVAYGRGDRPPAACGATVQEALRYALEQRRTHQGRLRLIAGGLLLSTPLVALSLQQMVETGRLTPADLPLRIALALGAYGVAFVCLGSDYFGQSAQEIDRLTNLLDECGQDEPAA